MFSTEHCSGKVSQVYVVEVLPEILKILKKLIIQFNNNRGINIFDMFTMS